VQLNTALKIITKFRAGLKVYTIHALAPKSPDVYDYNTSKKWLSGCVIE